METYVALIVGLAGSLWGLGGATWNKEKKRLTKKGFVALVIILIGFGTAVYTTIRSKNAAALAVEQRQKVKRYVYDRISLVCTDWFTPYFFMLATARNEPVLPIRPESVPILFQEQSGQQIAAFKLSSQVPFGFMYVPARTYAQYLERVSKSSRTVFKEILQTYSFYLEAEDILMMQAIIESDHLSGFSNGLVKHAETYDTPFFNSLYDQSYKLHLETLRQFQALWTRTFTKEIDPKNRSISTFP
jgi:hypothetical protein